MIPWKKVIARLLDEHYAIEAAPTKSCVKRRHFGRTKQGPNIKIFLDQNLHRTPDSRSGESLTTKSRGGSYPGYSANPEGRAVPMGIAED
jgi:hypothetical protein